MKKTLTALSVTLLSISSLYAHPGPAGHTHGDDWPFGLAIGLVLLAIVSGVLFAKLRKN